MIASGDDERARQAASHRAEALSVEANDLSTAKAGTLAESIFSQATP